MNSGEIIDKFDILHNDINIIITKVINKIK